MGPSAKEQLSHDKPCRARQHARGESCFPKYRVMPAPEKAVSQRKRRHLWLFLAETFDAKLAAPYAGPSVANASRRRKGVFVSGLRNIGGWNTLDATSVQQPTHVDIIWMLYSRCMQLLNWHEGPLDYVTLYVQDCMYLFFGAKAEGTALFNEQNASGKVLGNGTARVFLIVFIVEVFVCFPIKLLHPCGRAGRFCEEIHFESILQPIFHSTNSTSFFSSQHCFFRGLHRPIIE